MLRLQNGLIYVGSTNDLDRRLSEHASGRGSLACAQSPPGDVIYTETFPDLASAIRREKQLKGWSRAKKLALAEGRFNQLHQLAKRSALSRSASELKGRPALSERSESKGIVSLLPGLRQC